MIRNIIVLSRSDFEKVWPEINTELTRAISIYGYDQEPVFPNDSRVNGYQFDDCTPKASLIMGCTPMRSWQANDILGLLEHFHYDDIGEIDLYIHCAAGICRSGAVAEFANNTFAKMPTFDRVNSQIIPNDWVYSLLIAMYQEAGQS